ncbi:amylo-alpha-1,6-glucosidase [Pontibacter liquoris]|uniref:amylo-alpha-1,6-glucosidase n=1 Tax=Pontibacter liquoris TaxID=2905677 RepID=UPI001FA7C4E9|nr:GH116 family glycosyl hydrolase [Pontibacter liquoris]
MRIPLLIVLLMFVSALTHAQKNTPAQQVKIGLLDSGLPADEQAAVDAFLQEQQDFETVRLRFDRLKKGKALKKAGITHVWIHKLSMKRGTKQEVEAGHTLKEFVRNGGTLLLSMEAVQLLNDWGIEKHTFEVKTDTVKDEGFGRPLGFHSFKSHPVFEGLQGGAYSWKAKEDHVIRKIGFFEDNLPDTTIAKVIGTEWTYITFHENSKLVLEYQLGKGKIIAVGAYSYFAPANFNTLQLHRFYRNLFRYTAGQINTITPRYWSYAAQKVEPLKRKFPHTGVVPASPWQLPALTLQIERQKATEDFVSLAGRRMLAMGKQKGGIDEIWSHPFMSFRDIAAAVLLKGADSVIWLNQLTPSVIISPELLIREYTINGIKLREITTVSMDKPLATIHYEWEGAAIDKIFLKYTSNFRYMWPYSSKATSSIHFVWSPEMNAAVGAAQGGDLASIMGFSSKPQTYALGQFNGFTYQNGQFTGNKTDLIQLSGLFSFDASEAKGKLNAYVVAGSEGLDEAVALYHQQSGEFNSLFRKSSDYYAALLHNSLMVTTPDETFNTGYKWALARTDQFLQETPGLGTSLMAGFGTTARGWGGGQKISGRPGYAWYFGRDAQWSGMAINAYGGHKMVKKALDVFVEYQDLTGKIYHELTSSGAVHYDASDATPLFVVLAAHYLKYSGDLDYIRSIWPSLKKAMDFCYSTDTDGDGLIEITNVGHGWIEGGPLFGAHTEVYLAGCWVAALDAASYMSGALEDDGLAKSYQKDAVNVRKIIDKEFWDEAGQYFYNGKMRDGTFMKDETMLSSVPVYFDAVADTAKASKTMASFSRNDYSTDWGVRILPESSEKFNPKAYHAGMVWPLFSGFVSLAEYKTGNYVSGFTHMMNNLMLYRHYGLGSTEETLNGSVYQSAGVCSQQGWSETMVLQPVSEGMLGLRPDALANMLALSPRFPWHWNTVNVDNITFGDHRLNLKMSQTPTSTTYTFKYVSAGKGCDLAFTPAILPGTRIQKVLVNGKEVTFSTHQASESIQLLLEPIHLTNETTIEIIHQGGTGVLPLVNDPVPGHSNQGAKIVGESLEGNRHTVAIEGLAGNTYQFKILSNTEVKSVEKGKILNKKGNIYTIQVTIPKGATKYKEQLVTMHLKSGLDLRSGIMQQSQGMPDPANDLR